MSTPLSDAGAGAAPGRGRHRQKLRTRKALLAAAREMTAEGRQPSMEEVADRALVSRATAYRYFPNVQVLIVEAALDSQLRSPEEVLPDDAGGDARARVERVRAALYDLIQPNEISFRRFLADTLVASAVALQEGGEEPQYRGGRRMAMLERALAPTAMSKARRRRLIDALSVVIGLEGYVAAVDVARVERDAVPELIGWIVDAILAKGLPGP